MDQVIGIDLGGTAIKLARFTAEGDLLAHLERPTPQPAVPGAVTMALCEAVAELDPGRQQLLLEAVGDGHQCLVSATHLGAFNGGWHQGSQVITVEAGAVLSGQ